MKYIESIKKSIEENLDKGSLVIMGQDIRAWGGAGGLFKGLFAKYPDQIIDTPISEGGVANIAVGVAMSGVRVIIEYTFIDFILHSADQIINQAAKVNFMSNGEFKSPVVFRAIVNSGRGYGATHSQSLENLFFKVPGLEVMYPSNQTDAYDMMNIALKSDMPTLFVEHKLLHDQHMTFADNSVSGKQARIINKGDKLTIVSYGKSLVDAYQVIEENSFLGVELIDLRFLNPIDFQTVINSVKRTRSLLVIDECYGVVGSEIIAKVGELVKSPISIKRLTTSFEPIAVNKEKEHQTIVTKDKILNCVNEILKTD